MFYTHVNSTAKQKENLLLNILKGLMTIIGFIFKMIFKVVGLLFSLIAQGFMIFVDVAENFGSPNHNHPH